MATDTKLYRLATKITDESFDLQQLALYHLYLSVGKFNIRVAVADPVRNKFLVLEDYELTNIFTPLQVAQQLEEICREHAFLRKPDWAAIRVSVKNQKFTLIPATLFDTQAVDDYLALNCDLDKTQDLVYSYQHNSLEAVNIFAIDKYLVNTLKELFPEKHLQLVHQTSALTEGLLHHGERTNQPKLFTNVDKNTLHILVIRDGKLEFCNQFQYTTPEDFMYYLVFAMQEQKLNPDADAVTIWGDLTHDSALFTLMRKYLRHVHFGKKPSGVHYSYKLEDQFEHRYLDIYSLHFCE